MGLIVGKKKEEQGKKEAVKERRKKREDQATPSLLSCSAISKLQTRRRKHQGGHLVPMSIVLFLFVQPRRQRRKEGSPTPEMHCPRWRRTAGDRPCYQRKPYHLQIKADVASTLKRTVAARSSQDLGGGGVRVAARCCGKEKRREGRRSRLEEEKGERGGAPLLEQHLRQSPNPHRWKVGVPLTRSS